MTYLYIEQGSNVEVVTAQMLQKLYEIASSNSIETCVLKGNLQSQHCYDYVYDYLTGKVSVDEYRFPDLFLNITDGVYMSFADPVIANYWINSSYGDGTGITTNAAQSVTTFPKRLTTYNLAVGNENQFNSGRCAFYKDQTITSFNELGRFTNITNIPTSMFRESSLQSIDLSNITSIEAAAFTAANLTGVVNIPKLTTWAGRSNSITVNMDNQYFGKNTNMTEINIGSQVPVAQRFTEVKPYTFIDCTSLTKVTGLDNVTSISIQAFKNCSNLADIDIDPTKLTAVHSEAFRSCTSLTSLDLSNVTSIGSSAFYNSGLSGIINLPKIVTLESSAFSTTNITECNIGSTITSMGGSVFMSCHNLTDVSFPSTITTLKGRTFYECDSLQSFDFSNITTIESQCFQQCTGLQQTVNLSNITSIYDSAFAYCNKLTVSNLPRVATLPSSCFCRIANASITIPKEVENIGTWCLADCANLSSVVFETGSNLKTISNYAFRGIPISSITLPEGVTTLGIDSFSSCNSLTLVDIPSTVTSIGNNCFRYSNNGIRIICRATTPPTLGSEAINSLQYLTDYIYVPDASVSAYQSAARWSTYSSRIKGISQLPNS